MGKKKILFSVTRKDFRVDFFRAGGPGGQNQNKRNSACRITHKDSGAVGISRTHKQQDKNKKEAFKRLISAPKFKVWLKRRASEVSYKLQDIEKWVDDQMCKVRVEKKIDGKWVAWESS